MTGFSLPNSDLMICGTKMKRLRCCDGPLCILGESSVSLCVTMATVFCTHWNKPCLLSKRAESYEWLFCAHSEFCTNDNLCLEAKLLKAKRLPRINLSSPPLLFPCLINYAMLLQIMMQAYDILK